jgi:UDP-N-acetylmuramoylalanine--D-glutamate ligase
MMKLISAQHSEKQLFSVEKLQDAIPIIVRETKPGSICLLSPAAASYDQFHNFEHRGDTFRKLVKEL